MIDSVDDSLSNDVLQPLQIDHHSRFGIDLSLHADVDRVVVAVSTRVVAFSVRATIPIGVVIGIVQSVRGREGESWGDDHRMGTYSVTPASAARISFCCAASFSRSFRKRASLCMNPKR